MPPITVHINGVTKLLSDIKPYKSSGPDGIPAFLLKEVALPLARPLTLVFQASLNQQKLSSDWKVAHVVPVFKKGIELPQTTTDPYHLLVCAVSY